MFARVPLRVQLLARGKFQSARLLVIFAGVKVQEGTLHKVTATGLG
jgi:hypothetical protein